MADYKEIIVEGREYQRHCRLVLENPLGGTPSFNFVEEKVTELDGLPTFTTPIDNLVFPYVGAYSFLLYNSTTGELYPSTALNALVSNGNILFTETFLREVLLSLYKAKAEERDAA
jgi:hypothetical protein